MIIDQKRLDEDPDYINSKRFEYSLQNLLERYPEGCPDRIIANCLGLDEEDVEALYNKVVDKLKQRIGVE